MASLGLAGSLGITGLIGYRRRLRTVARYPLRLEDDSAVLIAAYSAVRRIAATIAALVPPFVPVYLFVAVGTSRAGRVVAAIGRAPVATQAILLALVASGVVGLVYHLRESWPQLRAALFRRGVSYAARPATRRSAPADVRTGRLRRLDDQSVQRQGLALCR